MSTEVAATVAPTVESSNRIGVLSAKKLPDNLTLDEVMNACKDRDESLDNSGFCLACGERADNCEPDASEYKCHSCGKYEVYGAEQILIMFG